MNGVVEDSTGDLIRAGYVEFVNIEPGQSVRTDAPEDSRVRWQAGTDFFHRWTGTEWVTVPQEL